MKILKSALVIAFLALTHGAKAQKPVITGADLSETFKVDEKVSIPNATLKTGTYSIRILDQLSDRMILEVDDVKGKPLSTFLALKAADFGAHSPGVIPWKSGQHLNALRGFVFPGGGAAEFVYPKSEAVEIAKASGAQVEAIDAESDNPKFANKKLSTEDMRALTLWTLTPTRVGAGTSSQPAIEAKRYEAPKAEYAKVNAPSAAKPMAVNAPRTNSRQVASLEAPTSPSRSASPHSRTLQRGAKSETPSSDVAQLPRTASQLPLIAFIGLLALGGGFVVRRSNLLRQN